MDAMSWADCWSLVLRLWPRWKPNEEQVALWHENLAGKPRSQVVTAIRKAAAGSYANYAKLAAVLKSIPVSQPVQKRNAITRSEVERAKIDNDDILAELQAMEPDALAGAVAHARKKCGKVTAIKCVGAPETWTNIERGMVWDAAYKLHRGVHYHEDA